MNKYEIAQYLVNLETLISKQTANVHQASQTLATEYERQWGELKKAIQEDKHE